MTPDLRRSLSLVVPVFNEETSIAPFLDRVLPILRRLEGQFGFEILFVNDGSFDGTERAIDEFARRVPEIGLLSLSRNFGKEAALFAGLRHARGDAVIPLDVDLQDPPTIVLEMVERWSKGAKIVNARRGNRDGDGWLKRVTASLFYRIFNTLADRPIPRAWGISDWWIAMSSTRSALWVSAVASTRRLSRGLGSSRRRSFSTGLPAARTKRISLIGGSSNWRWTEYSPRPRSRCGSGHMSALS